MHVGDALACQAPTGDGFAGLIVDMFSDGAVIPALQQPQTWQRLRQHLRPGGKQRTESHLCSLLATRASINNLRLRHESYSLLNQILEITDRYHVQD